MRSNNRHIRNDRSNSTGSSGSGSSVDTDRPAGSTAVSSCGRNDRNRRNRSILHRINRQLKPLGLQAKDVPADGNCMLNALSDQMIGSFDNHLLYRKEVCNYMLRNRDLFMPYVVHSNYDEYVRSMMEPGATLGQEALAAFCQLKGLTVTVHQLNSTPIRFGSISPTVNSDRSSGPGGDGVSAGKQLHLFFHRGHYLSVVDRA